MSMTLSCSFERLSAAMSAYLASCLEVRTLMRELSWVLASGTPLIGALVGILKKLDAVSEP